MADIKFNKILAKTLILSALLSHPLSVFGATIFSDNFSSGNFDGWTSADSGWDIKSKRAEIKGDVADSSLTKSISTVDYDNLQLEFFYQAANLEEDDYVIVEWSGGDDWNTLMNVTDDSEDDTGNTWTQKNFNLENVATEDFQFRFRASLNAASDTFKLDDVTLSGDLADDEIEPGSISGVKFEDLNENGIRDNGELGLIDWVIELWRDENQVATASTNENGEYLFSELSSGDYIVKERNQTGWQQTAPTSTTDYIVEVVSGEQTEKIDFGNARRKILITGYKWSDLNNDGVWQNEGDGAEPVVESWPITLTKIGELVPIEIVALSLTGSDGRFSFMVSPTEPTTYRLTEETRDGWTPTAPRNSFFDIFIDPNSFYKSNSEILESFNFGNFQINDNPIVGGSGSGAGSGGGAGSVNPPAPTSTPLEIIPIPSPVVPSEPVPVKLVVNKVAAPSISLPESQSQGLLANLLSVILGFFNR